MGLKAPSPVLSQEKNNRNNNSGGEEATDEDENNQGGRVHHCRLPNFHTPLHSDARRHLLAHRKAVN